MKPWHVSKYGCYLNSLGKLTNLFEIVSTSPNVMFVGPTASYIT